MRIEAYELNLHSGFNILKQRILDVVGKPSDPVLSHRPITTSWSTAATCGAWDRILTDLSRCTSEDEFLEKLTIALKNQRYATWQEAIMVRLLAMCAEVVVIRAIRPKSRLPRARRRPGPSAPRITPSPSFAVWNSQPSGHDAIRFV
jgi:hypothetical protein